MTGFIDRVVAVLSDYKKSAAETPERKAAKSCYDQIEYAISRDNIGNLTRIFDGFAELSLPQDMKEQQDRWKNEYYAILKGIKKSELDKHGKLKKNSNSAKLLEKMVIKILHFGYQDISNPDGTLKDELYEAFKLKEYQDKLRAKDSGLTEEDMQQRRKIADQLSDEEKITQTVLKGYCLYPLFKFFIDARIEADQKREKKIASLMDHISLDSIHSNILARNEKIKDQLKKQIVKLESDLKLFPTDPQDLRYSPDDQKFINISKKLECLNSALSLFKQYERGTLSGSEVLTQLRQLEKELRTKISHKAWYKRKFYINTPSESARLITSLCKQIEKDDPDCKPSPQVNKKGKKKLDSTPKMIL